MKIKLTLFFILFGLQLIAQEVLQIGVSGLQNQVRVINLNKQGILLIDKSPGGDLKIKRIDSDLNFVWEVQSEISNRETFVDEYYDGKFVFILLEQKSTQSFSVLKISTSFAALQKINLKSVANFQVSQFKGNENGICLAGNVKNEPFLIFLEEGSTTPKFISGGFKGETRIQSLDLQKDYITVTFLNQFKKNNQVVVRDYQYNSKNINSRNLVNTQKYEFLSARYFNQNGKELIIGNYGFFGNNIEGIKSSQGIYISDLNQKSETKYYGFENFKNFFGFLNEKQKERLDKQVKKKKDKGNEYVFNYRLYINDIISKPDGFLISTEVYIPEFQNNSFSTPFFGNPYMYPSYMWGRQALNNYYWMNSPAFWGYRNRSNQVFDGFKYLEGAVISINEKGELKWDASLDYKNVKYFQLKPHSKLSLSDQESMVFYISDRKFNFTRFNESGEAYFKNIYSTNDLKLISQGKKTDLENIEHWHDNFFLNWGLIRNPDPSTNFKQLCYIQKIPIVTQ
jgi:hypothetical protein